MGEVINKKVWSHNFASMADIDLDLGDYSKYYGVELQFEWAGLDAANGVVAFLQRDDPSMSWDIPVNPSGSSLSYIMTTAAGSVTLQNGDLGSTYIGVRVAKNGNSTGTLSVFLTAKEF